MSSPIQPPPPNIRSPSVGSQQPSIPSPYAHHLPPPNLPNNQPNTNGPLPPPPRVTELPPLLSSSQSPRSSSPSFSSHHTLLPASSLSSEHTLPPIPPPRTSTPPFAERRPSMARTSVGPAPSTSVLSHPSQQQSLPPVHPPPTATATATPATATPATTTTAATASAPSATATPTAPASTLATAVAPTTATGSVTSNVPASSSSAAASPSSQQGAVGYRPLNVRDALTYLDQVKVRFSDQPDVYNRFLDIMKDFKSQAIDTPGVIERVSTLFKGHPTLISGFNTFLPPGYRIECSTDPREPDLITVTTPNGVTTTTGGSGRIYGIDSENANSMHSHLAAIHHPPPPPGAPVVAPVGNAPPQPYYSYGHMHQPPPPMPIQATSSGHPMHPIPPPQPMMSQPIYHQPPLPSASASNMTRPSQPQQQPPPQPQSQQPQQQQQQPPPVSAHHSPTQANNEKRSPVEFNHAINYVNKIKNRFSNEPEIYKQFLEILQTYQKDQKPIQEVYAHVQYLFSSAPDLLDEFKQFLPDITGQPASSLFDTISPTYYSGSKRSAVGTPPPHGMLPPGKKKRTNATSTKKNRLYQKENGDISGTLRDPYSYPNSPFDPVRPSVSAEEIELFDRIRKHIGNKPSYEEFLKTLNLYTQQIFDLKTLIEQVSTFIGNNKELFEWFKSIVGYEPKDHPIEKPSSIIPKPDLAHCKTTADSPSYRVVPKNWQSQPCSGRDQIAWEVLNDEYVSHPIWASEDDGFVASRKSQYEEAMHRCEEERYDYNMNIDANLNVIALLEPIAHRIESMSAEERANFKLRPGLGGQSVSIYERIIKKIYDKERGTEIIELLYSNPAQVVPILLKRLKQKDEEWKRAQREWNKIWREMDAKNFYRALDYQGITFKSNDRKAMAPKGLVAEIELLQHEKKLKLNDSKPIHSTASYQFKFPFEEPDVFKDVTRVIYSFIDRQSGYTSSDREKIRTFVQTFVPLCFQVDDVVPEGVQYASEGEDDDMAEDDDDNHSTNTEESESDIGQSPSKQNMSPRRRMGRSSRHHHEDEHTMDLLRDVLTKNQNALDEISQVEEHVAPPLSNNETQEVKEGDQEPLRSVDPILSSLVSRPANHPEEPLEDKLLAAAATAVAPGIKKRILYSFFCNTTFYCFFRLYEMLYCRLNKLRALGAEMQANPHMGKRVNKVARDLGLYNNRFEEIDTGKGCYKAVLEMIDRFFDGDIDQQVFEEHTRYVFVTDAYLIFTIDKLVHSMVKQIQAITVDPKSVELIRLFRSDKGLESMSPRTLSVYRLKAEDIVGSDENLYKINFDNETKNMTIQLIGKDDYMLEPTAEDKYEDYVASYMDWLNTTEGIDASSMKPTFLTRNLRPQDEHLNKIFVQSKLQYKIDQDTYHMYYIVGSEDVFVRPSSNNTKSSGSKWQEWVESSTTGWSKNLDEKTKQAMEEEARKLLNGDA